jgi:hypothetical protein
VWRLKQDSLETLADDRIGVGLWLPKNRVHVDTGASVLDCDIHENDGKDENGSNQREKWDLKEWQALRRLSMSCDERERG